MKEGMPETQAELESLLNDRIQAKTGEAVTNAVKDVMARAGAKRLPDAVDYNKDALGASEDATVAHSESRRVLRRRRWVLGAGRIPTRPHDDPA